jgi:hypothetical protein
MHPSRRPVLIAAIAATLAGSWSAQAGIAPVAADVLLTEGDALAGSVVSGLNPVFTDGDGRPGSIVALADGRRLIWYDGGVVFDSGTVVSPVLTGGESTIGIGNGGAFIYSPSAGGDDAVWTQSGLLLLDGQPDPVAPGQFNAFNSRPSMLPDGRAVWVAGYSATAGGATLGRAMFRATTGATPVFESLLRTGDLIGGVPIGTTGITFNFQMSDSGEHLAVILLRDTGSTLTDSTVLVDGVIRAEEGAPVVPAAPGENWQAFAGVAINDAGDWLLAGDTSGVAATDNFLAYNGSIQVREGDSLGGEALAAGSALRAISINNLGQAVHAWNTPGDVRKLFFASDAGNLADSVLLLKTGTPLDLDGNGSGEAVLVDVLGTFTTTTGLSLAEDGAVYIQASYTIGGTAFESLLRLDGADVIFANGFDPTGPL